MDTAKVERIVLAFAPVVVVVSFCKVFGLPVDALHVLLLQWISLLYVQPDLGFTYLPGPLRSDASLSSSSAAKGTGHGEEEQESKEEDSSATTGTGAVTAIEQLPQYPTGQLPADPHFRDTVQQMIAKFMAFVESDNASMWEQKVSTPRVSIFQKKGSNNTYKVMSVLENTPLTCFDMMSDAVKRQQWDSMTAEVRVVQEIDKDTRIVYVKTKGVMFTSSRDVLVLSHKTVLPGGRLLNVTKSVEHPDCPERTDGTIRMVSEIGGMICSASKSRDGWCDVLQLIDGDPKGSIPQSVLDFVATRAFPQSTEKMNARLRSTPPLETALKSKTKGKLLTASEAQLTAMKARVDDLEAKISKASAAAAETPGVFETLHGALEWAAPFMVATVYFVSIYSIIVKIRLPSA